MSDEPEDPTREPDDAATPEGKSNAGEHLPPQSEIGSFAGGQWRGPGGEAIGPGTGEPPSLQEIAAHRPLVDLPNHRGGSLAWELLNMKLTSGEQRPSPYITPMQPSHFLVLAFIMFVLYQCNRDAMYSMREAGVRSKVSRAKNDMRTLATGIESFYVDANAYPNVRAGAGVRPADGGSRDKGDGPNLPPGLGVIETSGSALVGRNGTVYMNEALYPDPFATGRGTPFVYYSDAHGWVLDSAGPDGDYDMLPSRDYTSSETQPSARLLRLAYDPTNGTISDGDVWRVKQ